MIKCRLRWVGHAAHMGNRGSVNRVLVGKLWGKRPLQIPRCRWEDNIKMDPKEIQWEGISWINLSAPEFGI